MKCFAVVSVLWSVLLYCCCAKEEDCSAMKKIRVILNGKGASSPEVRSAIMELREEGHPLEVRTTWEGGDAARFAKEAVAEKVEILVAGGGDGTIHEVLNGLLTASDGNAAANGGPALAVLPLGTANDFARGNHIPLEPYDALKLAVTGKSTPIDVGTANDVYFANVASGGFGAMVTVGTPKELKGAIGGGAYALVGAITAAKMEPYKGEAVSSTGESASGRFIAMAVGNGRQAGGNIPVAPDALVDDGLIDVLFVGDFQPLDLGTVVSELGDYANTENKFVNYRKVKSFEMKLTTELPVNLDGEPYLWDKITFEVKPKVLNMILPDDDPLLSATPTNLASSWSIF